MGRYLLNHIMDIEDQVGDVAALYCVQLLDQVGNIEALHCIQLFHVTLMFIF